MRNMRVEVFLWVFGLFLNASATLVQELRFIADARDIIAKDAGEVVVIGLFSEEVCAFLMYY